VKDTYKKPEVVELGTRDGFATHETGTETCGEAEACPSNT